MFVAHSTFVSSIVIAVLRAGRVPCGEGGSVYKAIEAMICSGDKRGVAPTCRQVLLLPRVLELVADLVGCSPLSRPPQNRCLGVLTLAGPSAAPPPKPPTATPAWASCQEHLMRMRERSGGHHCSPGLRGRTRPRPSRRLRMRATYSGAGQWGEM